VLVTVVIPALDEQRLISRTLAAVCNGHTPEQVEVIVVDGGSRDATPQLIPPGVTLVASEPGRARQMNHGATLARGEVLVFCHADTQLPAGWREEVLRILAEPGVSGGSFNPSFMPPKGVLHILNRLRYPPDWRIVYGDQAIFSRRSSFERAGRYPERPLFEDVALARALAGQGRLVRSRLRVTTSSRRFLEVGPLRHLVRSLWLTFCFAHLGLSPERAARRYHRLPRRGRALPAPGDSRE
jgi:uncharacterized protein